MLDKYNRKIDYVRVSITDQCNLRCIYCMKEGETFSELNEILTFSELEKSLLILNKIGITKLKITGGEPMIRSGIFEFIRNMKKIFDSVTITTNACYSINKIQELCKVGIDGINISLDTLNKEKYTKITRGGNLNQVLTNIDFLIQQGQNVKINTVLLRNWNEDEILDLVNYAEKKGIPIRFIELMPIGEANNFIGIKREEILKLLQKEYGYSIHSNYKGNGPAEYFTFKNCSNKIGFIDAMSHKFCEQCNRIRLDAKGNLITCLHYQVGISFRDYLEGNITEEYFIRKLQESIFKKPKENNFLTEKVENINMNKIGG